MSWNEFIENEKNKDYYMQPGILCQAVNTIRRMEAACWIITKNLKKMSMH